MRIITGLRRGRKLKAPPGDAVRPTPERVKEALFNILQFSLEDRVFLDLFAGTGQIGLEALSRGAKRCVFVDNSKLSLNVLRQNIAAADFADASHVVEGDFSTFLLSNREKFDLVFLDPPYRTGLLQRALPLVTEHMQPGGAVICEHPAEEELPEEAGTFRKAKEYRYGKIKLTVYRREDPSGAV